MTGIAVLAAVCLGDPRGSLTPSGWTLVRAKCVSTAAKGDLTASRMSADKAYAGDKSLQGCAFTISYKAHFLFSMLHDDVVTFGSALKAGEVGLFWIRPGPAAGEVEAVNDTRELSRVAQGVSPPFPCVFGRRGWAGGRDDDSSRLKLAEFIGTLGGQAPGGERDRAIRVGLALDQPQLVSAWAALALAKSQGLGAKGHLVNVLRARRMPVLTRLAADAALVSIDSGWRNAPERMRYVERVLLFADTPQEVRATLDRLMLSPPVLVLDFVARFLASDDMDSSVHRDEVLGALILLPRLATTVNETAAVNTLLLDARKSTSEDVRRAAESALASSMRQK